MASWLNFRNGSWSWRGCKYGLRPRFGELRLFVRELDVMEFGVESAGQHQLFMVAPLDDGAVVQHKDRVRAADGGEPVGNHDGSLAFHQTIQSLEDQPL